MTSEIVNDQVESLNGALIQHGHLNDRVYLMRMPNMPAGPVIRSVTTLAQTHGYSKIFAKVKEHHGKDFKGAGFTLEAEIPGFYNGNEAALFLGRYFSPERARPNESMILKQVLDIAKTKQETSVRKLGAGFSVRRCDKHDTTAMVAIYDQVFPTYPFPIHDPAYLQESMLNDVAYFGIEYNGDLIALASAEMDTSASAVEMTDFATRPLWLGYGFAGILLAHMENAMKQQHVHTAYTIARALSPGMNITFAKLGYHFAGRLTNNTNISGQIESMNVWYKRLVHDQCETVG